MRQDCQKTSITPARIDWQDSAPFSTRFSDVYFSRDNGVDESRYVFLQQNRLAEQWQLWDLPGSFVIGETGFGTGLNFFCAWELWRTLRQPDQHLHFVSVEKYPLTPDDLQRACNLRPEFAAMALELLAQYPPLIAGSHRLHFAADNLTLTLIFDDAIAGLTALDGLVDAWFLDGFAPAANPDMWCQDLFLQLARLSRVGTRFATFTAAGEVKRGLRAAGFSVEKWTGFGRKRHMLRGEFSVAREPAPLPVQQQPWFQFQYRKAPAARVAIVGGGLAGCCTAYKLAQRGWQVTLFEAAPDIAQGASGNPTGITYTRLSQHDTAQNRFYQFAYLYACRFIRSFFTARGVTAGQDWNLNGVVQLAFDEKQQREHLALAQSGLWPQDIVRFLDPAATTELLGISCPLPSMLMTQGGWLNPAALCRLLLDHPLIKLQTAANVHQIDAQDGRWRITVPNHTDSSLFDTVVLANTFDTTRFPFATHLPLRWVRGQISYVPATAASAVLQHAVNYDGYINPVRNGIHCIGATFTPRDKDPAIRAADHAHNLAQLEHYWPAMASALQREQAPVQDGRVGFRCQTPDYLPVIGPLPDQVLFRQRFADIGKGHSLSGFEHGPMLPGLYVCTAFGAKGITGAPLAAEILAAYINGEPQPIDRDVLFALHPARFLQRELKRQRPPATGTNPAIANT